MTLDPKPIELPAPDLGSVILGNGEEQPLGHSDDAMLSYGRACAEAAVAAQAAEMDALRRWKSTIAPRLDALQGLLTAAQHEAHAGREAVASLASEREANALLTDEVEALRADAERYRWLRDASVPPHNFYLSVPIEFDGVRYTPQDVDAAIDAARAALKEQT